MQNLDWCIYTYKHRIAFRYVANRLIKDKVLLEKILERGKYHDMDKILLYLFFPIDIVAEFHKSRKGHHRECLAQKSYEDLVEMVIDLECGPYTKPDKTTNCYDFIHKLIRTGSIDSGLANSLLSITKELGIDYSYNVTREEQCIQFLSTLPVVTEKMILLEVIEYVRSNPEEELRFIHNCI